LKPHILTLILLLSISLAKAGPDTHAYSPKSPFWQEVRIDSLFSLKSKKGYFPSLLHNLAYQATSPTRIRENDLFWIGGATIITASLVNSDPDIDRMFRPVKERSRFLNDFTPHFTDLGDKYGFMMLAGFSAFSMATGNNKAFRTSLLASQALICAGIWVRVGKIMTGRIRPLATYSNEKFDRGHFYGPFSQYRDDNENYQLDDFTSFPSGHTASAFAVATVFSRQYSEYRAVPFVAYSLASLVGISRMVEHDHWASDVFVGAVLGYLCGKQVTNYERKLFPDRKYSERRTRSTFFPSNQAGIPGIGWMMSF